MLKGTVKWFDPKKGFGFVLSESGQDVFVHYSNIDEQGYRSLKNGQTVEYDLERTPKGLLGKKVKIIISVKPENDGCETQAKDSDRTDRAG